MTKDKSPTPAVGRGLLKIYDKLFTEFGPRGWWPARSSFEVMVGAILTQNTAWRNVEKAIYSLKKNSRLTPKALRKMKPKALAALIKPAGYYNIKAERLKNFLDFLFREFGGSVKKMFRVNTGRLREELLKVKGIGPETADSMLLYAAGRPVFVVDAYTKRIFSRHRLIKPGADYEEVRTLFMDNLPRRAELFNEYHALIVELGKKFCKKEPLCGSCPLETKTKRRGKW